MQPKLCTKCKKNMAVVFITKIENGVTMNEGYCLKCARSLGIPQIEAAVKQMGFSEDDLESLSDEMSSMFGQLDNEDHDEPESRTATFPLFNQLMESMGGKKEDQPAQKQDEEESEKPKSKGSKKHKFLDSYCMNLTGRAREGKLDKVIGRDVETERVIQILNRRQKNNPCLIGEPGVGKTAIAEGLAQRIAAGDVPYKLRDKEVFLLDLTALVAGTQFRGQFESRMKSLITEIKACGNIILVIDEVHNLVGAGDAEGSMNAANILKPALSRGEIQVIGATTFNEYRKHIEKDAALERRFQPVTVNEPSMEEACQIMQGIAKSYADFHGVTISPEIARQCVILSERYITDRFLPDKAIDLLDEACSDLNLRSKEINELARLRKIRADFTEDLQKLNEDTENVDYEAIANLRSRLMQVTQEIEELEKIPAPAVTIENLARIIELWTKIPASKIKAQEYKQIKGLADRLKEHIVGQDEAVEAVARAIRRNRVGISPKKKPVSFIFVGPTGVGKTELVKCLANDLFDSVDSLIRLDMSEFMEKHTVSKLIGSPPGYVGYDEAGQLTEKIRRRPYAVVLFDEIEKAHPDVLNILLQVLDDGRITDAQGRVVNFENTVIVMTSNAGSEGRVGGLGFGRTDNDMVKEKTMNALKEFLRPEFINRVDEIITFNRLTEENFLGIADIMLAELRDSLLSRELTLTWDDSVRDYLVKKAFSVTYGARNLRREIQKSLEDPISEKIIDSFENPISALHISTENDEIVIKTK
ncbi:MAG: ATP-dependent Clp protease ATP-binding subunit [Oscillospiraceae bacterium]|nr:ATP-dependent Clp protease ATP-binding subunit [Oscillospiraceae bacterium]